jgi:hypothetical protein
MAAHSPGNGLLPLYPGCINTDSNLPTSNDTICVNALNASIDTYVFISVGKVASPNTPPSRPPGCSAYDYALPR